MFKKIDENTPTDGRQVIAAFKHPQYGWVKFLAQACAEPYGVYAQDYAPPTHWCEMPPDPVEE